MASSTVKSAVNHFNGLWEKAYMSFISVGNNQVGALNSNVYISTFHYY